MTKGGNFVFVFNETERKVFRLEIDLSRTNFLILIIIIRIQNK